MIPDALPAVRSFLLANTGVAAQVGTRVYAEYLDASQNASMPRKVVVLKSTGGPGGILPAIGRQRVDIRCYGETVYEARKVYRTVYDAMRYSLSRVAQGDTLLHQALPESEGLSLIETGGGNGDWPFIQSSWLVTVAHIAIP